MSNETEAKIADAIEHAEEVAEPEALSEAFPEQPIHTGQSNQADLILSLASDFELFHSPDGTLYADIHVDGHRETYPIASKRFDQELKRRFFEETCDVPRPEAVQKAKDLLEAKARYHGEKREVYLRVGNLDGTLYVDLCDEHWNVIEISPRSWRLVQNPPVRFCRFAGMQPLPVPERGSVETLRCYLNVSKDEDFVLLVSWLLAALRHGGPYPAMVLFGEHGTAKSTTSRILHALVDPNSSLVRATPRDARDVFVAAKHAHVLVYDNLSSLPPWLSDILSILSTGGGQATRRLYTDDDETLFDAQRPVILNGIEQMVSRADLADRCIFITLEPISADRRVSERKLFANFEQDRAAILGGLLDMMVAGLRTLPEVELELRELPRMADFAIWAAACEGAQWPRGTFDSAYRINRAETVESVLNIDTVASAVLELLSQTMQTMRTHFAPDGPVWKGTASELLAELTRLAGGKMLKDGSWPKTANALSNRLTRAVPFLRERGIQIKRRKEGHEHKRIIDIFVVEEDHHSLSRSSASSAREYNNRGYQDDGPDFEEGESVEPDDPINTPPVKTSAVSPIVETGNGQGQEPTKPKGIFVKKPKKKL